MNTLLKPDVIFILIMEKNSPKVAVVMAAYNADSTIVHAAQSVLHSSIRVHLFIVDDGSKIPVSEALVKNLGALPENITVIRRNANHGPSGARNLAIQAALHDGFTYAAILDADDFAHPDRFSKQSSFLDENKHIAAVGTWGASVDERTLAVIGMECYPPTNPLKIKHALCFDSCIINTSVMFRMSALEALGAWDESLYTAEDYDLFCRLSHKYELANIPEYLVSFRLSENGISRSGINAQRRARLFVQLRHFRYRYRYWQAWAGVMTSMIRIMLPTPLVENFKILINRRKLL